MPKRKKRTRRGKAQQPAPKPTLTPAPVPAPPPPPEPRFRWVVRDDMMLVAEYDGLLQPVVIYREGATTKVKLPKGGYEFPSLWDALEWVGRGKFINTKPEEKA